jgi:hypothetical protein
MKSNFWQERKQNITEKLSQSKNYSESEKSKVIEYYQSKIASEVKGGDKSQEEFYQKVKNLLLTYGEVSDAIGRLTDKEYFSTLTYEQKQRYTLELSSKYLKAKERFYREIKFETV